MGNNMTPCVCKVIKYSFGKDPPSQLFTWFMDVFYVTLMKEILGPFLRNLTIYLPNQKRENMLKIER